MSLIVTIFSLVFLTELVSWIGKSVLLELVCCRQHVLRFKLNSVRRFGASTVECSWVSNMQDSAS